MHTKEQHEAALRLNGSVSYFFYCFFTVNQGRAGKLSWLYVGLSRTVKYMSSEYPVTIICYLLQEFAERQLRIDAATAKGSGGRGGRGGRGE